MKHILIVTLILILLQQKNNRRISRFWWKGKCPLDKEQKRRTWTKFLPIVGKCYIFLIDPEEVYLLIINQKNPQFVM